MNQLAQLKNPDVIMINGEPYIVLNQKELFFDDIKKTMDMCIELVLVSDPQPSAMFRLIYVREHPEEMKFYTYDAGIDRFVESELVEFEL